MSTGSYFDKALTYTNGELIETMRHTVGRVKYDTIIGTGLSGTIFAARVAPGLSKQFAIVRKPNDGSHSGIAVEGQVGKRWVFVDDFISSGRTFRRVLEKMADKHPDSEFVGVYQYEWSSWQDHEEAARNYGSWVRELTMGPEFGPLTKAALLSKEPYSDVPLKPTEDRRRLEIDFPDGYGRPTIYDLDNSARLTCENKNALPLIEEVEAYAKARNVSLRRLVGERMNRIPRYPLAAAAPTTVRVPKVTLENYQDNILTADEMAAKRILDPKPWDFLSA